MLNKRQYEVLKPYERQLNNAYRGNFLVGMGSKSVSDLINAYNDVFDKNERYTNCNKCIFNMVTALGKEYFEYKESHPEVNKPKNKGGRPKKEAQKEIEVELADGSKGKMANSVERTDINGNKYRLK